MIIVSSSGRSSNSSTSSSNRSINCSSAVAAVVEAITTSRNFSISSSSSSSRSCNSSSNSLNFYDFSLKNNNSDGGDNRKNTFKDFSECPKTSDHNSNATPFKELQCFDALS